MTTTEYAQLTGDYTLDAAHSRIGFVARHAMVTKVRGAFTDFSGTAHLDENNPANSSVQVRIQAASINTGNPDRDAHLHGNDFLQMDEYPEITFNSTEITRSGDTYEVTGDLTIKGVTRTITVPLSYEGTATDPFGNVRAGFEGSATINRRDYGVTWNAALETGGVLVSDKVVLEFDLSVIKQA